MEKGRLDSVVKEWCGIYKARPSQGAVVLINMVIAASGCPERITTAQFEDGDVKEALEALVTSRWTKAGDDTEGRSSSSSREKAVVAFVGRVVGASKESFLYDGYLLSVLTSWLGALSNSSARVLREAATRTACELVRALIAVAQGVADLQAKNGAQAARERARAAPAPRRLHALAETGAELAERARVLQGAVEEVHRAVFAARYRDVVPSVRGDVCRALAAGICAWPAVMLRDTYLKYVAWLLNDAAADVRLAAVEGVRAIYARCTAPADQALLATFTERFRARLVAMALDVATPVAVAALDVCRVLATALHALDEDDLRRLYTLVSEADPARRRAAGAFAQAVVFAPLDEAAASEAPGSSQGAGSSTALAETRIRGVVELVLNHSLLPDMPCYVVDALWGLSPALTDWKTMCAMLLRDDSDGNEEDDSALSHEEQTCLAGVLACCCRRVAGLPITPDDNSNSNSTNTTQQQQQEECQEMTAELARALPRLLVKYRADGAVVAALAEVVPALSLTALEVVRLERACVALAEELAQVVARHSDPALLATAARGLAHLLSADAPHRHTTDVRLVLQTMVSSILSAAAGGDNNDDAESNNAEATAENTLVAMQRLACLAEFVDVADVYGNEHAVEAARAVLEEKEKETDAHLSVAAIAVLYHDVLWRLRRIDANAPRAQVRERATEAGVAAHRDALVHALEGVLTAQPPRPAPVTDAACIALLDVATVFTPRLAATPLRSLACTLSSACVDTLAQYFRGVVLESLGVVSDSKQQQDENDEEEEENGNDKDEDEEDAEEEEEEGFSREARIAAAFAKAAIAGGLPRDLGASFLCLYHFYAGTDKHRVRLQQHLDQLCKSVLQGVRNNNARQEWEVVVLAIEQVYLEQESDHAEHPNPPGDNNTTEDENEDEDEDDSTFVPNAASAQSASTSTRFATFSRWLARSYGPVPAGDLRTSMFQVVQECVMWALESAAAAHTRVGVLAPAGMVPFVAKLTGAEARLLVATLDRALAAADLPTAPDTHRADAAPLAPLYVFAEKLRRLASAAPLPQQPPATPLARAAPPRLELVNVDDAEEEEGNSGGNNNGNPSAPPPEEPVDEIESAHSGDDDDDEEEDGGPTTKRRRA